MVRSDLQRALECIRDASAAASDRASSVEVVKRELAAGGMLSSDARDAIATLHRARAVDPAGPLAVPLIEVLASAVRLRIGGDPSGLRGLPALLHADDSGAFSVARASRPDQAGESWHVDCRTPTRARALAALFIAAARFGAEGTVTFLGEGVWVGYEIFLHAGRAQLRVMTEDEVRRAAQDPALDMISGHFEAAVPLTAWPQPKDVRD